MLFWKHLLNFKTKVMPILCHCPFYLQAFTKQVLPVLQRVIGRTLMCRLCFLGNLPLTMFLHPSLQEAALTPISKGKIHVIFFRAGTAHSTLKFLNRGVTYYSQRASSNPFRDMAPDCAAGWSGTPRVSSQLAPREDWPVENAWFRQLDIGSPPISFWEVGNGRGTKIKFYENC